MGGDVTGVPVGKPARFRRMRLEVGRWRREHISALYRYQRGVGFASDQADVGIIWIEVVRRR